ncbi:hypothetical protein KBD45_05635 [Candidatus Dojkabacteria bacterium]|nr:hypothetical protein [Candidatus Dojkabacteria bacterium]
MIKVEQLLDADIEFTPDLQYQVNGFLKSLLSRAGYIIGENSLHLTKKRRVVLGSLYSEQGDRFIKLTAKGCGEEELLGYKRLKPYFPVIGAEAVLQEGDFDLIIQPFVPDLFEGKGSVTDLITEMETETAPEGSMEHLKDLFGSMRNMVEQTMTYGTQKANNDIFFYDRLLTEKDDNKRGRIETFYADDSLFNIGGYEINKEDLFSKKWNINGIEYDVTIDSMLGAAKQILNPNHPRPIAITHGDGHSCNIYTSILNKAEEEDPVFAFIDLETAGLNSFISEMANFLVHNSLLSNYLIPQYYKDYYMGKTKVIEVSQAGINKARSLPSPTLEITDKEISIKGLPALGTSEVRKSVAESYVENYVKPVFDFIRTNYGEQPYKQAFEILNASLLLRFLGVINLRNMSSLDQLKTFGLLLQTVGEKDPSVSLDRFLSNT